MDELIEIWINYIYPADRNLKFYITPNLINYSDIHKKNNSLLTSNFFGTKKSKEVWMSHADQVSKLPKNFKVIASSNNSKFAIVENNKKKFYGVQFHPEVTHTAQGSEILKRFIIDLCRCKADWSMPSFIDNEVSRIKQIVGEDEVILGLSGGVDSSVAAALIQRSIGSKLTCVFVDKVFLEYFFSYSLLFLHHNHIHPVPSKVYRDHLHGRSITPMHLIDCAGSPIRRLPLCQLDTYSYQSGPA